MWVFNISKALFYVVSQMILSTVIKFNAFLLSIYFVPGSERQSSEEGR